MTVIAVVKNSRGRLVMAGDRRNSWGHKYQSMPHPKINKESGIITGCCGSGYLCDLLVFHYPLSKFFPEYIDQDPHDYMFNEYTNKLGHYLRSKGYVDHHKNLQIPGEQTAVALVAVNGKCFEVLVENPTKEDIHSKDLNGMIEVMEVSVPFAVGCGDLLAQGSLLTTENMSMTAKERLIKALEITAQADAFVDNKIDIISE